MFHDSHSNPTFQPKINKRSKSVSSALTPLVERQFSEQALRKSRLERLSEDVNRERSKEVTFAPKLSKAPSYLNTDERVPLADRAVPMRSGGPLPDPEATHRPKINENAKGDPSMSQNEIAIKRRVRELWQTFADGPSMSMKGVMQVLATFGVSDAANPELVDKFLAAMNVNEEDEDRRYVQYDRFLKVMASIVRAADAPLAESAHKSAPNSQPSPPSRNIVRMSAQQRTPSQSRAFNVDDEDEDENLSHKGTKPTTSLAYFQQRERNMEPYGSSPSPQQPTSLLAHVAKSKANPPPPSPTPRRPAPADRGIEAAPKPITVSEARPKQAAAATYRPTINPQSYSEMVAARREQHGGLARSKISERGVHRQQQLEEDALRREMEGCTFAPKTLGGIDPKVSGLLSAARTRSTSQPLKAKSVSAHSDVTERCGLSASPMSGTSNQPVTRSSSSKARSVDPFADPPGFDKVVRRLAEGRARAVPKFEDALRETPVAMPAPEVGTDPKPFNLVSEARHAEREQRKPLLYVDVNLPHGKSGRIGIYKGDDPQILAHNFCVTYGLDTDTLSQLTDMLKQKIDITTRANAIRKVWA